MKHLCIVICLMILVSLSLVACQLGLNYQAATNKGSNSIPTVKPNTSALAEINVRLGLAYLEQGQLSRAKNKLLTAHNLVPNKSLTNGALAYYYQQVSDISRSHLFYRKAIEYSEHKGEAYNNYAVFLCQQKQFKQALHNFQLASKDVHYGNTARIWENAGFCAERLPDFKLAKKFFIKAIKHDDHRFRSYLHLAKILLLQGNSKGAQQYLKRYAAAGHFYSNTKVK